jgi:uncharacterized protein (TIGR02646 family)
LRYIDLEGLRGQASVEALIVAAEHARVLVAAEPDADARRELIKANRKRWVDFRPSFESLVGQKCWYTESQNPGTDDDVDHFRPKGNVEGLTHGGYWWEAFNWRNLRLSCHRANRTRINPETGQPHGKGAHFPLLNEGQRWMGPAAPCHELPALLDPTNPSDPPMLTYGIDGRAALAPEFEGDVAACQRIDQSRRYLHLDWPSFVEQRTALYGRIATRVDDGERVAEAALGTCEPVATETLRSVARDLIQLTQPHEPYSKAALAYISVYRDKLWVKRMVLKNVTGSGT